MKKKKSGLPSQPLTKTLAENIAFYRKAAGWTQLKVSQQLGVEIETVSRYERGVYIPSVDQVEKLAELFRIPAWAMFIQIDERKHVLAMELADQLSRLSEQDAQTLQQIFSVYVQSHGN